MEEGEIAKPEGPGAGRGQQASSPSAKGSGELRKLLQWRPGQTPGRQISLQLASLAKWEVAFVNADGYAHPSCGPWPLTVGRLARKLGGWWSGLAVSLLRCRLSIVADDPLTYRATFTLGVFYTNDIQPTCSLHLDRRCCHIIKVCSWLSLTAVNSETPPPALIVYGGLEPLRFTNIFPVWEEDKVLTQLAMVVRAKSNFPRFIVNICWAVYKQVAVWCSGNALVLINAVVLHRARLVLGWVTTFG